MFGVMHKEEIQYRMRYNKQYYSDLDVHFF